MDKILTVTDVADVLKVKPITVREMFREKRLRAFKVGKAWRTTETMLQEDLEAMARGEKPSTLTDPGTGAEGGAASAEPAKPSPATEAPPSTPAPAPKAKAEAEPAVTEDETAAAAEPSEEGAAPEPAKPARKPKPSEPEDDSQQLLF